MTSVQPHPSEAAPTATADGIEHVTPPSNPTAHVDDFDENLDGRRFRTLRNVYEAGAVPLDFDELQLLAAEEPATFAEAEQSQHFRRAMMDEMASIKEN